MEKQSDIASSRQPGGKFLTFSLGAESYGIGLTTVREIIALMPITPVPTLPSYVRGVMNLRGAIIPVIDLRRRFSMAELPDHDRKCIIVVDVDIGEQKRRMGVLVDAVAEVRVFDGKDISPAPDCIAGGRMPFVAGLGMTGGGVTILLNMTPLLSAAGKLTASEQGPRAA